MSKSSFKDIINSEKPVLIDFYADWCGPCKQFAPIIQEVKDEIDENARVIKIDVDKNQALSNKLQVRSIPTVIIYQKGEIKFREAGLQTKQFLLQKLRELAAEA